ncbi:hypothetical protein F2Q70_00026126 [Brassica cretica]|uniref:Uncharacterized protein n=1 Tax=Brassica cretica TaxID=69181 RepID=A0A8S9LE75_BRACR|nr:hypothetical protein F2Q70_00026126 [Brassica cretica]
MLKIDVARLNALRPKPKPSEQPPDTVRTPSVDGDDPMEEDRVSTGRTLRRRKEKVARHLKSGLMKRKRKISKRESSEFLYISHSKKLTTTTDYEHHHESFAVETTTHTPGANKVFTDEELLNMQRRDHTSQTLIIKHRSTDVLNNRSRSTTPRRSTTIKSRKPLDPNGFVKAIDGRTLHISREDIADMLQVANGAENLFMHQCSKQKTTKEFNDTAGGMENSFNQRSRHITHPPINTDVPTIARQPEFSRRAYDLYGRLVPKTTSETSNTPYHEKEISADTYAALTKHQFNLESLGQRLQRIENTTAAMKDKWRRGDDAMSDFTDSTIDTKVDQPVN